MQIIIIAAMAKNRVIGYQNTIPWQIKGEQKIFKKHTIGHTVIMGRKTYESIGKPLTGRKNIIISSQANLLLNNKYLNKIYNTAEDRTKMPSKPIILSSIEEALKVSKNEEKVFIIGGAEIYKQTINLSDYIYLTILNRDVIGDSFFPKIGKNFTMISSENLKLSEEVKFNVYKRQE